MKMATNATQGTMPRNITYNAVITSWRAAQPDVHKEPEKKKRQLQT
jgi:hypothetical protein